MAAKKTAFFIDVTRFSHYEHAMRVVEKMMKDRGYTHMVHTVDKAHRENPYFVAQNPQTGRYLVVFGDTGVLKVETMREWRRDSWITDRYMEVDRYLFLAQSLGSSIKLELSQNWPEDSKYELWSFDNLILIPPDHKLVPKFKVFTPQDAKATFSADILSHLPPLLPDDAYVRYFAYPEGTVLEEVTTRKLWIVRSVGSS